MRFDATLKDLLEESPAAWPHLLGRSARDVKVIDANISTVTGAADKVLHIRDDPQWILHLEFQAGPNASLPRRTNLYNSVLEDRHLLPVQSCVVLLRPEAHLAVLNGLYECRIPHEPKPYRTFRYDLLRIWELPPARLLSGDLGLLPLAPISAVRREELPDLLQKIKRRLQREAAPAHVQKLWTATYVLLGLRFQPELIDNLLKEVLGMEESSTYQAIVAKGVKKGAVEALRKVLCLLGQDHFGRAAGSRIKAVIEAINDPEELERLTVRLAHVQTWEELLSLPAKPAKRGKA